jgi:hypothetical protein
MKNSLYKPILAMLILFTIVILPSISANSFAYNYLEFKEPSGNITNIYENNTYINQTVELNTTQFETGEPVTIKTSWLTSFIDSFGFLTQVKLNDIQNPDASHTINMGGNTLSWIFTNPVGGMFFNMTGGWSGHVIEVLDSSNVPNGNVGDHLMHLESNRANVVPLHVVNTQTGATAFLVDGDSKLNGNLIANKSNWGYWMDDDCIVIGNLSYISQC